MSRTRLGDKGFMWWFAWLRSSSLPEVTLLAFTQDQFASPALFYVKCAWAVEEDTALGGGVIVCCCQRIRTRKLIKSAKSLVHKEMCILRLWSSAFSQHCLVTEPFEPHTEVFDLSRWFVNPFAGARTSASRRGHFLDILYILLVSIHLSFCGYIWVMKCQQFFEGHWSICVE